MLGRISLGAAVACALLLLPGSALALAPASTTGQVESYGGGGMTSLFNSQFNVHGCVPKVTYDYGTAPLAQGGFQTWTSYAHDGTGTTSDGSDSDYQSIDGFTPGTLYYWRSAVEALCNGAASGEKAYGAQKCFRQIDGINDPEDVPCPGDSTGGTGGNTGGNGGNTGGNGGNTGGNGGNTGGTGGSGTVPRGIPFPFATTRAAKNGPIVYVDSPSFHAGGELWVMRFDGTRRRRLTHTRKDFEFQPEISPNGQWVAYALEGPPISSCLYFYGCFGGSSSPAGIYVRRLDGRGGALPVTAGLNNSVHGMEEPSWAPSGHRLAFRCRINERQELCAINLDGSGARRLTKCNCVGPSGQVTWSPRGDRIVFEGGCNLMQVSPSGGAARVFSRNPSCQDASHTFAPNGRAVLVEDGGGHAGGYGVLEGIGGTGGARHRWTDSDNQDNWSWPTFSPDGRAIAASHTPGYGVRPGVYLVSTANSSQAARIAPLSISHNPQYLQLEWGAAPRGRAKLPHHRLCGAARKLLAKARRAHHKRDAARYARVVKYLCG